MSLTTEQKSTLKAFILATPVLSALADIQDYPAIATIELVKYPATDFIVYKTYVEKSFYTNNISDLGTTFNWAGAGGYIARSQGERDAWKEMFGPNEAVNPSKANIRLAFDDIFSGSGAGAVNNRSHLLSLSKRKANILEKLFATGTGSDASPATMAIEGSIAASDVQQAMQQ